jgi:Tol biopolymer transport system component
MNADGSNKRRLTHNIAIGDAFSSFSPDGSRVAFTSGSEGQPPSIYVIYLDGSGLKKIAEGSSPNWSPDF